jgi:large subunit ribosomal protein L1
MGTIRNVDMSSKQTKVKKVENPEEIVVEVDSETVAKTDGQEETAKKAAKPVQKRVRSKKYVIVNSQVDKTRKYDVLSAMELVKKLSYSKFDGTITADIEVKDTTVSGSVTLPHETGRTRKIVVVNDKVLKQIEAGNFDFDVLLASPDYMPKLAKYAKELGPRGLMPNPKNGTLTASPEKAAEELSSGKRLLKTEKKQPLIHISIGKVSMDTKKLIENLQAIANALPNKISKVTLSATMGPGVKVDLETL